MARSQRQETSARAFNAEQAATEIEEPAGNPIAAPVRSQGSAAEARIARPSVRRDPDLVAEEPVRPSRPEPRSLVDQGSGMNFKSSVTTHPSNDDQPIFPQVSARSTIDRERVFPSRGTVLADKLNLPLHRSSLVAEPGAEVASSRSVISRDLKLPAAAELHETFSASPHTPRNVSKSPVSTQSMPSLLSASKDRSIAASSTAPGQLFSRGDAHGEAPVVPSPTREMNKSASGQGPTVSTDFPGLRDRSTPASPASLGKNRPSLPGTLRSISAAHQPASSASQSIVEVHIGRVEVRAPSQSSSKAPARESNKAPSLDDYLRGRAGRGGA